MGKIYIDTPIYHNGDKSTQTHISEVRPHPEEGFVNIVTANPYSYMVVHGRGSIENMVPIPNHMLPSDSTGGCIEVQNGSWVSRSTYGKTKVYKHDKECQYVIPEDIDPISPKDNVVFNVDWNTLKDVGNTLTNNGKQPEITMFVDEQEGTVRMIGLHGVAAVHVFTEGIDSQEYCDLYNHIAGESS